MTGQVRLTGGRSHICSHANMNSGYKKTLRLKVPVRPIFTILSVGLLYLCLSVLGYVQAYNSDPTVLYWRIILTQLRCTGV